MTTTATQDQTNVSARANTTMATWAGAIARALKEYGVDAKLLFARQGIDFQLVNNPMQRIPVADMTRLWNSAVTETGDHGFGLTVARQVNLTTFHALSVAAVASEDAEQAAQVICQYASMVSDGIDMRLETSANTLGLILSFRPGFPRFADPCVEASFASMYRIGRESLPDLRPDRVSFRHRCKGDPMIYRAFFGCPVAFGADHDGIHMPRAGLSGGRLPTASEAVAKANRDLCRDYVESREQGVVQLQVKDVLHKALEKQGLLGLEQVSAALAMSERKLQRQLRAEGCRFRDLQDEVRAERARALLEQDRLPAARVAESLGFDSVSAFTRACKRWFGKTPREIRRSTPDA
jgi:AraC-like DNA-binding protein